MQKPKALSCTLQVADWPDEDLAIIDTTNLETPSAPFNRHGSAEVESVFIYDDYIFVASRQGGLWIYQHHLDCVRDSDRDGTADTGDTCIDHDGDGYGHDGTGTSPGTCIALDCHEHYADCTTTCTDDDEDGYFAECNDCNDDDGTRWKWNADETGCEQP